MANAKPKIFISYRRSDSGIQAGRLYDYLRSRSDVGDVFLDIDSLPMGVDFSHAIEAQIAQCKALLLLITPFWLDNSDASGRRRIDDPNDFVRLEVRAALAQKVVVVPVLFDGAVLPDQSDLPADMREILRRQAFRISRTTFEDDAERLASAIVGSSRADQRPPKPSSRSPIVTGSKSRRRLLVPLAALALAAAGLAGLMWQLRLPQRVPAGQAPNWIDDARSFAGTLGWRDWFLFANSALLLILLAFAVLRRSSPDSGQAGRPGKIINDKARDRVFICYRRADTAYATSYLYDRLSSKLGQGVVFKDVDSIPFGVDFPTHVKNRLEKCQVALIVIGSSWLHITDEQGNRRLEARDDHVRTEIEVALSRSIPVIPVLIDREDMPTEAQLPDSIKALAARNGVPVRPDPDFAGDVERLARAL